MGKSKDRQVLVVEDDVDLCNAVLDTLHQNGCQALGVTDMRDAILRMKNQKYDCLIFDMRLGDVESGADLIKVARDRKQSLNAQTPILVISGYLDRPTVESIAGSIQGALVKPFEMAALLTLLEKVSPST